MSEQQSIKRIIELEAKVYCIKCPICGQRIYGLSEDEVQRALIEHMNEKHG
jgi:predicted small metal-binding protein